MELPVSKHAPSWKDVLLTIGLKTVPLMGLAFVVVLLLRGFLHARGFSPSGFWLAALFLMLCAVIIRTTAGSMPGKLMADRREAP